MNAIETIRQRISAKATKIHCCQQFQQNKLFQMTKQDSTGVWKTVMLKMFVQTLKRQIDFCQICGAILLNAVKACGWGSLKKI